MQWEYKLVALGLIVDATEPHQREKHEQILNDLGREGWEAVAYAAQSDTVLLKRAVMHTGDERKSGSGPDSTAETT
jgi:pyocin large subunit-like protein